MNQEPPPYGYGGQSPVSTSFSSSFSSRNVNDFNSYAAFRNGEGTDSLFSNVVPKWQLFLLIFGMVGCDIQRTEMRVIMCCNKCEEKVREEISEVYGEF